MEVITPSPGKYEHGSGMLTTASLIGDCVFFFLTLVWDWRASFSCTLTRQAEQLPEKFPCWLSG